VQRRLACLQRAPVDFGEVLDFHRERIGERRAGRDQAVMRKQADAPVFERRDSTIGQLLRAECVRVLYLAVYSPDFNLIEPASAIVKKAIRAVAPRNGSALRRVAYVARRRLWGYKRQM